MVLLVVDHSWPGRPNALILIDGFGVVAVGVSGCGCVLSVA